MTEQTIDNYLFIELQDMALTPGKPFPGFAVGKFVDMLGREVEFGKKELNDFLANTLKAIKDATTKGMPGLPIDARQHDKGDAAGWITGAELGEVTDSKGTAVPVIKVLAQWTKLGAQLIRDKIQTNFSPTVDLEGKVIKGGSLTNWPASVDENGTPLFDAIELAQGVNYLQVHNGGAHNAASDSEEIVTMAEKDDKKVTAVPEKETRDAPPATVELTQAQIDELVDTKLNDRLAALEKQRGEQAKTDYAELAEAFGLNTEEAKKQQVQSMQQLAEMVREQANLQWQRQLADMQRENRFAELSQRVTGGSPDAPRGIPVGADEIKNHLMKLPDEDAKFWAGVLETTVNHGLTEFSELGHGRKTEVKRDVPAELANGLKEAIANGVDPQVFFDAAGYGNADDYDLSKYAKEENK